MKFINVRLLVDNYQAAVAFWRDLMGFAMTYGDEAISYAYFDTGSAGIELLGRERFAEALGATPESRQTIMVFQVDDVDATYADLLQRGAKGVVAPRDMDAWGVRTCHISDPDGHLVEIYTSLRKD